jgi:hypothetical protein
MSGRLVASVSSRAARASLAYVANDQAKASAEVIGAPRERACSR